MTTLSLRQPKRHEVVLSGVVTAVLIAAFALMVGVLVTVAYPWNPITKLSIQVEGLPRVGGDMIVAIAYCKVRDWTPHSVRWSLVNDVNVILPETTLSLPVGCATRRLIVLLPRHLMPGVYQAQEELTYAPWPWRQFVYVARSKPFILLPAEESK